MPPLALVKNNSGEYRTTDPRQTKMTGGKEIVH